MTVKKAEEALVQGMKMVQKGLRGAAEVLGDEHTPGALVTLPSTPSRTKLSQGGGSGSEVVASLEGKSSDLSLSLLFHPVDDPHASSSKDRRQLVSTGRDEVSEILPAAS